MWNKKSLTRVDISLFLQSLCYNLRLNKISKEIEQKHKFAFSLDDIVSRLIYGRILSLSSKRSTIEFSKKLLEYKDIELHHFHISQESDLIQEQLYKNLCQEILMYSITIVQISILM